ncbi:transcription antitermination factor NusB [Fretibacter rubidus]|uniref:transcription antitermination factor NusB n=1 Tax=Fretibacter rubidus TaxID=570162 RepID=UPI00352AC78A
MTDDPILPDGVEDITDIQPTRLTMPQRRRAARLAAVQALYQMDLAGTQDKTVINEFRNHYFGHADETDRVEGDEDFFEDLVKGVVAKQDDVDAAISAHLSEKWKLKRLDMTLRAIMRAASFEIIQRPDVPALVVIDEYVSIAADFFEGGGEMNFVNASLDKLAKSVRSAEFGLI